MKPTLSFLILLLSLSSLHNQLFAQTKAEVLIVLGSDTAIWDGMNTGEYNCYYNAELYTNPGMNTYEVMNPAFRNNLSDDYGITMKLTWWMMAGNIFRYADNTNIPFANIMTLYLMKKYHHENITLLGDELSLHYHTFKWCDYDGDGISYWNQAHNFLECFDDFNYTLAQFLLEEEIFSVSFRSGWHYMDNEWQKYLNELLPYSMHNDYPHKRTVDSEPIDNIYDWSQAPAAWIPYHPSPDNYQIPGSSKGWNLRSTHLASATSGVLFEQVFNEANKGIDQVMCVWGHLPEEDFNDNLVKINEQLHKVSQKYPYVKFRYCSAVEAMQRWLKTSDNTPPKITLEEIRRGEEIYFRITSDENIFQTQPFVAVKDVYENFRVLRCRFIAQNIWETREPVIENMTAKVGAVICDYVGNQTIEIKRYLPDDIYVDNLDNGYTEISGQWITNNNSSWGTDCRVVAIQPNDTARAAWTPDIEKTGSYNIFIQVPEIQNSADQIIFRVYSYDKLSKEVQFSQKLDGNKWQYITTTDMNEGNSNSVEMLSGQSGKLLVTDVIKFSPLVTQRSLFINNKFLNLDTISELDTTYFDLAISNKGITELTVTKIESVNGIVKFKKDFPFTIEPMSTENISFHIYPLEKGLIADTLIIYCDDEINPAQRVVIQANVQSYFKTIDNENEQHYTEYGNWSYSVAQAYGPTSRISWLIEPPGAKAVFSFMPIKTGLYEIKFIVPTTENAANHALHTISIDGYDIDSIYLNQNINSGQWVTLGKYFLPFNVPISVSVINDGKSTEGVVLRVDGMSFHLIHEITDISQQDISPSQSILFQNYPNPFNPTTTIKYLIPRSTEYYSVLRVQLKIIDILGREIATLVNEAKQPGTYEVEFNAMNLPSGVYLYRLNAGDFTSAKKMILIR